MCHDDDDDHDHDGTRHAGVAAANRELEAAFASLDPAVGRVDPLAAAFAAGRNAGRRELRNWRAAAAIALAGGALSWLVPTGAPHQIAERRDMPAPMQPAIVVERPTPPASDPWQPLPAQSVLVMSRAVGEGGLQALPAPRLPKPRHVRDEQLFY